MAGFSPRMPILLTALVFGTVAVSSVSAQSAAPFQKTGSDRYQFTKIRIKHYDAGMIADLITRPDGIIAVPPNFVVPAGATTTQKAAPPTAANPSTPANQNTSANVLPEGVRRIFVLESDNSLVIEATPEGLASLTLALSL